MLSQKLVLAAAGNAAVATYVDDVFSIDLWDGDGASTRTITNGIDLAGEGGMVWGKTRSTSVAHVIADTENGVSKNLFTNTDDALEDRGTGNGSVDQFNSNGFTIGNSNNFINYSGHTACSWTFRKCPGFFDVVTYTGNGSSSGQTISHSLGSTPGSIWIKRTSAAEDWCVYHRSIGTAGHVRLNKTSVYTTNQKFANVTSTSFDVYDSDVMINGSGDTYVAYIFAHDDQSFGDDGDEAIIKCGSYTGDGTSDGSKTVDLGFEPQWILTKRSDAVDNWHVCDVMRGQTMEGYTQRLRANTSAAESANSGAVPTSTGFKLYSDNSNGGTFIYIAIRRPHKPAENSTDVLDIVQHSGNSTARHIAGTSGSKPADMHIIRRVNTSGEPSFIGARILNSYSFPTDDDSKEAATNNKYGGSSALPWDVMTGINLDTDAAMNTSGNTYINYFLTRHPGVFEAVTYEGNGANRTISHNLGVAPDLMIFRNLDRSSGQKTPVYVSGITHLSVFGSDPDSYGSNPGIFLLNAGDKATFSSSGYLNHTHPTSSVFSLGDTFHINENAKTHIAFLFANLAGICKIGTYTGVGGSTDVDVDCGFTSGARLVIIKKATNISAWRVFDTTRGINSGTETYWFFNNTFTATFDVIDPINSGFRVVNETAAAQGLNVSGHVYIFMAFS